MARINLLPWRSERRKLRQKEFMTMLGLAAGVALVLSFLIVMYYNGQIEGQMARNQYLRDQIVLVDQQIKEIEELDKKKANLLARKQVIEQLQASRSQMVHLFDELVRTIPEGVRLSSIKQSGQVLTLDGMAQSNARVSSYMRNLEESGWMTNPDLSIIEAKGSDKGLPNVFSLKVTLKSPSSEEEAVEPAAPAPAAAAPAVAAGGAP
ncbi:PilN domain-containing protein [Arenimonas terrae]|jgi:type IV pilus assembly protein PilN|uniref:Fimbrial protein n=1 Tax=Arenimonas terrae TaxID=2546226 RepID=A0A5C4RRX6_9GAMM|nr:PilN domain-containing protein [Arenimonas terrae]TNJ33782.1 fimbrial protein [Arenimonas terrae]